MILRLPRFHLFPRHTRCITAKYVRRSDYRRITASAVKFPPLSPCFISVSMAEEAGYRTRLSSNYQCFPLPIRPLRLPSYCRVYRHVSDVLSRLSSNFRFCRRFTAITVEQPHLPLTPVITADFPFHPDHCRGFSLPFTVKLLRFPFADRLRGVSLPNKFNVKLPPSSTTIRIIAEVSRYSTSLT